MLPPEYADLLSPLGVRFLPLPAVWDSFAPLRGAGFFTTPGAGYFFLGGAVSR